MSGFGVGVADGEAVPADSSAVWAGRGVGVNCSFSGGGGFFAMAIMMPTTKALMIILFSIR